MLRATLSLLQLPSARDLRQQLRALKAKERMVRKVARQMRESGKLGANGDDPATAAARATNLLPKEALPRNNGLEEGLMNFHATHRDPRARLTVLRHLLSATILSVASPVGPWDPLDLKPQPFALGRYVGLPLFTSLPYLQTFCHQFGHTVRGPDGALWGSPNGVAPTRIGPGSVKKTSKKKRSTSAPADTKRIPSYNSPAEQQARFEAEARRLQEERRESAKQKSERIQRFEFDTAIALPVYGAFDKPYLYGYYGDTQTMLQNASMVPEKVEIVINPASPLELVLGRETAAALANPETIIQEAMRDVHMAVRSELSQFFATHCPEVVSARSALMPKPAPFGSSPEHVEHELVVVVQTPRFADTMARLSQGKLDGLVEGHESMAIVSSREVPEHIDAVSTAFYRARDSSASAKMAREGGSPGMVKLGQSLVLDSEPTGWGGKLGDPTMGYLESHSIFSQQHRMQSAARESGQHEDE